jgi:hypothetical protein
MVDNRTLSELTRDQLIAVAQGRGLRLPVEPLSDDELRALLRDVAELRRGMPPPPQQRPRQKRARGS